MKICLAAFLMDFSAISAMTILPFFIFNQLHRGADVSGVIGGIQGGVYSLVCLATAGFVGRAKNGMAWAYVGIAGYTIFTCLIPFSGDPWTCGTLVAAAYGFLAFYWPAQYSWLGSEPDPEVRGIQMAQFNIAWSLGFATGPLLAGPLYDADYRFPFVQIFILESVLFYLVWTLPHEREHFQETTPEILEARADHDRESERFLPLAWSASFVSNFVTGVTRMVFPKRIEELVDAGTLRLFWEESPFGFLSTHAATKYSWLAFFLSFAIMLTFLWMGKTRFWRHRALYLLLFQVLAGGAFFVLGYTESLVVMALCFMVVGGNSGISFFSSVYYSVANPAHKHRRSAINEGVVGGGAFVGSILFGYLGNAYGITMPFRWTPLFVAVFLILQLPLLPRNRRAG